MSQQQQQRQTNILPPLADLIGQKANFNFSNNTSINNNHTSSSSFFPHDFDGSSSSMASSSTSQLLSGHPASLKRESSFDYNTLSLSQNYMGPSGSTPVSRVQSSTDEGLPGPLSSLSVAPTPFMITQQLQQLQQQQFQQQFHQYQLQQQQQQLQQLSAASSPLSSMMQMPPPPPPPVKSNSAPHLGSASRVSSYSSYAQLPPAIREQQREREREREREQRERELQQQLQSPMVPHYSNAQSPAGLVSPHHLPSFNAFDVLSQAAMLTLTSEFAVPQPTSSHNNNNHHSSHNASSSSSSSASTQQQQQHHHQQQNQQQHSNNNNNNNHHSTTSSSNANHQQGNVDSAPQSPRSSSSDMMSLGSSSSLPNMIENFSANPFAYPYGTSQIPFTSATNPYNPTSYPYIQQPPWSPMRMNQQQQTQQQTQQQQQLPTQQSPQQQPQQSPQQQQLQSPQSSSLSADQTAEQRKIFKCSPGSRQSRARCGPRPSNVNRSGFFCEGGHKEEDWSLTTQKCNACVEKKYLRFWCDNCGGSVSAKGKSEHLKSDLARAKMDRETAIPTNKRKREDEDY